MLSANFAKPKDSDHRIYAAISLISVIAGIDCMTFCIPNSKSQDWQRACQAGLSLS